MINTARVGRVVLAIGLSCTLSMAAEIINPVERGELAFEETFGSYLNQSVEYYDAGDFARSLQAAEDARVFLEGKSAVAYNNICSAQMRLGAYDQAAAACTKALELDPGCERARANLAWVYERVVEQSPTVGAYLNLSVVRYWQGELDKSVAASEQALVLDPSSAVPHNNICAAFTRAGKLDQAIRECVTALTMDPDYELAKNNLAWARSQGNN